MLNTQQLKRSSVCLSVSIPKQRKPAEPAGLVPLRLTCVFPSSSYYSSSFLTSSSSLHPQLTVAFLYLRSPGGAEPPAPRRGGFLAPGSNRPICAPLDEVTSARKATKVAKPKPTQRATSQEGLSAGGSRHSLRQIEANASRTNHSRFSQSKHKFSLLFFFFYTTSRIL